MIKTKPMVISPVDNPRVLRKILQTLPLTDFELKVISDKKLFNRVINQHRARIKKDSPLDRRLAELQTKMNNLLEEKR